MKERIQRFRQEAQAVRTTVQVVTAAELEPLIESLARGIDSSRVVDARSHGTDLSKDALADQLLAVSEVEAAIAESGSIVVDLTKPDHLASLLPEHHVAIVTADRIYDSLKDWLSGGETPASWTLITGPSKTADIEKVLVHGAHGPVGLTVIIVD